MTHRRALLTLALLAPAALAPGRAMAAPDEEAMRRAVRLAVAEHVLPRQTNFAEAAALLATATAALAEAPAEDRAEAARQAWVGTALAFQGVRHLRFGPMDAFDRGYRIAFFPDTRNSIGREMAELLRGADPASITQDAFDHGRVASQGLPAAERLLFGDDAPKLLAPDQGFRRAYLAAIGRNLHHIAAGQLQEWRDATPSYGSLLEGAPDGPYRTPIEGFLTLFKVLHGSLEFIAERQVARPLGASPREAAPRRAEAWRSGRSLALVRAGLLAQEELWRTAFANPLSAEDPTLAGQILKGFATAGVAVTDIAPSLEVAITEPAGRDDCEALIRDIGALRRLLTERAAAALGLPVGFNSMDGD